MLVYDLLMAHEVHFFLTEMSRLNIKNEQSTELFEIRTEYKYRGTF